MNWQNRSVTIPATCSLDGHLMNILERPHSRGCTTSECDDLTFGTFVSTTVQEHIVNDHYIVEKAFPDPVEVISQEVIETLKVLVNDESSVGAYTLSLVSPQKLNS